MAAGAETVSIVVPVYNGERFLRTCIRSAIAQEAACEIIVHDDGSTDRSSLILGEFAGRRLRVIRADRNSGLFPSLRRLVTESKGDLVQLLAQDDALVDGAMESRARFMGEYPKAAFSYSGNVTMDENDREIGRVLDGAMYRLMTPAVALKMFALYGCIPGSISTVMFRRPAYDTIGGFNTSLRVSGDYDLWARMASIGAVGYQDEPLVMIRHHPRQLSRRPSSVAEFIREDLLVMRWLLPRLREEDLAEVVSRWRTVRVRNHFRWAVNLLARGRFLSGLAALRRALESRSLGSGAA